MNSLEYKKCLFENAITMASEAHKAQRDKSGEVYILHPLKISLKLLEKYPDDYLLATIGVLHDVVEDCAPYYNLKMIEHKFGERVRKGVESLTKRSGESPEKYLTRIMANEDAIKVKLEDLAHNMNILRLSNLTEDDFVRLKKYRRMHAILSKIEFKNGGSDDQCNNNQREGEDKNRSSDN